MSTEKPTYSDFLDPAFGPGEPETSITPGRENIFTNVPQNYDDIVHGLKAAETLGIKAIGDATPNVPMLPQIWRGLVEGFGTSFGNAFPRYRGAVEEEKTKVKQIPAYEPDIHFPQVDFPLVGKGVLNAVAGPPVDALRDAIHGYPASPFLKMYEKPIDTGTNALAYGGPILKAAKALGVLDRLAPLTGRVSREIDTAKAAIGKKVDKLTEAGIRQEAKKALEPLTNPINAEVANQFRRDRDLLKTKWNAIPANVKKAAAAGMQLTDPNAAQILENSPEAQDFLKVYRELEAKMTNEMMQKGLLSDEEYFRTRAGPEYIDKVNRGLRKSPIGSKNLTAAQLQRPDVTEDLMKFIGEKAQKGEQFGDYTPLVGQAEAAAHLTRKVNRPLATGHPYEVGLTKERATSTVESVPNQFSPVTGSGSFRQMTSGRETSNLANALIVRIEQAKRAAMVYDWAEDFPGAFAKLSPKAQRLVIGRVEKIVNRAYRAAGIEEPPQMLDQIIKIGKANPPSWSASFEERITELAQKIDDALSAEIPIPGTNTGVSAAKAASIQRVFSVVPDLFFPLYMSAQQAMFLGAKAISGPKAFARSLIAVAVASDENVRKFLPEEFLEEPRQVKISTTSSNPLIKGAISTVNWLSDYQNNTTKAINYFRTLTAISWALEEYGELPPEAQKFVDAALTSQMNLQKTAQDLLKTGRMLRGGSTFRIKHPAGPIVQALKKLANRKGYYGLRKTRLEGRIRLAENNIAAGTKVAINQKNLARWKQQLGRADAQLQQIENARANLLKDKKPIYSPNPHGPGRILAGFVEERQLGMLGLTQQRAEKFMSDLHAHLDSFHGDYNVQHTGFAKAANTLFVWWNVKLHGMALALQLHGRYALSGSAIDRTAEFIGQQQKALSEQQNLPPFAAGMGMRQSDKKAPDGTMLLYAPHGWLLLTDALATPEGLTHMMFPGLAGSTPEWDSDLHWWLKAGLLFSGQLPGKDRALRNSGYYSNDTAQYSPEQLARTIVLGRQPDLEADSVEVAWPHIVHRIFQSMVESGSEKLWAQGKTYNKVLTGQEPSELTIPFNPFAQYPKTIGGPYGPPQNAAPVNVFGMIPGGAKFAPFTTRTGGRLTRLEMQRKKALIRDANEAYGHIYGGSAPKPMTFPRVNWGK